MKVTLRKRPRSNGKIALYLDDQDYIQDENNGVYINGAYLGAAWQFRTDYKGSQDCKDCKEDRKKKNFGITKKKYIYLKP